MCLLVWCRARLSPPRMVVRHHRDVQHSTPPPEGASPPRAPWPTHHQTHMMALHRALLKWLIAGTPPALWQLGCLHQGIHPASSAHTGPYPLPSISATTMLTKGQPWRPVRSLSVEPPSTIASPSLASVGPHVPQTAALFSYDPTVHLPDLQPLPRTHGLHPTRYASPQAPVISP